MPGFKISSDKSRDTESLNRNENRLDADAKFPLDELTISRVPIYWEISTRRE